MTDMLSSVVPKSSQLNFDDMIDGKTITVKITKVSGQSGDQPIAINYEGDNGKPYYPCKSMRRVLIHNWGGNGAEYVGRSLTLYGDPEVKFGGLAVGGIRISHMSHISKEVTLALTATRANKKPFTVRPLVVSNVPNVDEAIASIEQAQTLDDLKAVFSALQKPFKDNKDFAKIHAAKEKRKKELSDVGQENQIPARTNTEVEKTTG